MTPGESVEQAAPMLHFVRDACGNYWRAYRAESCPACKVERVWEFDRERPAKEHAAHVARGAQLGLFRRV